MKLRSFVCLQGSLLGYTIETNFHLSGENRKYISLKTFKGQKLQAQKVSERFLLFVGRWENRGVSENENDGVS